MSTAYLRFPTLFLSGRREQTVSGRDLAFLCIALIACCAASVFALLYNSDQHSPVVAVQDPAYAFPDIAVPASPQVTFSVPSSKPTNNAAAEDIAKTKTVARNHTELLVLERVGDRNYIEFSVARSTNFQVLGPIQIGIWRIDTKHNSIEASVLAAQRRTDFKHISVNESVSIPIGHSQSLEFVINQVGKNQVSGYLSEPKNVTWQLAQNKPAGIPDFR